MERLHYPLYLTAVFIPLQIGGLRDAIREYYESAGTPLPSMISFTYYVAWRQEELEQELKATEQKLDNLLRQNVVGDDGRCAELKADKLRLSECLDVCRGGIEVSAHCQV